MTSWLDGFAKLHSFKMKGSEVLFSGAMLKSPNYVASVEAGELVPMITLNRFETEEEEWSYWEDVSGLVLEAVLVFLIIILVGVTFYCLGKKKRNREEDKELGDPEPPNYEDVMKKDKEELENLKDLPSYLEAINVKKSYVQTV